MDVHVKEYFQQSSDKSSRGHFHYVLALNEHLDEDWATISKKVPQLPRGWFELAHLSPSDRIEFTRDYWISKLPYRKGMSDFLNRFFSSLDDIGVYIYQKKYDDAIEADLVYSKKEDSGFYRGCLPITENEEVTLKNLFPSVTFPDDYLAFLEIHNGFCKATDCTGVIKSYHVPLAYTNLMAMQQRNESIVLSNDKTVDPSTLIPFYESFGMPFYQCFWAEWCPEQEMGNVYYSGAANVISDVFKQGIGSANMSFATFSDWLMFYLESIE